MTTTERTTASGRRKLTGAARVAAAQVIVKIDKANGEPSDPRVVKIAEGKG